MENERSVEVCVELNLPLSFALDFTLTPIDTGSATAGTMVNPRRACAARVTVVVLCVCVCVFVCPGRSSATHATKRQTRHTHGLSILLAPE